MIEIILLITAAILIEQFVLLNTLNQFKNKTMEKIEAAAERQELNITMTKYNLSITRLQLVSMRQHAIKNDDYENASSLEKSISFIDQLLNS